MTIQDNASDFEKGASNARTFGGAVYVGAVIAASTMFISFVLTAFPKDAYFSRMIMTVAGVMVGCSMLAFPVALHTWAITGNHRKWTTILYYVEMLIISVNTVIAFVSLLAKYAGYAAPEWVVLYEPFSIASVVYTVFAWGTVFLLDPSHKLKADEHEADARFAAKIAAKREEFIDSAEGEDLVIQIATADAYARFDPEKFSKEKKRFGTGRKPATDAESLEDDAPQNWQAFLEGWSAARGNGGQKSATYQSAASPLPGPGEVQE